MIKILIDSKMDTEIALEFLEFSTAGMNFGEVIKKDHNDFTSENAVSYVSKYYHEHKEEIEKSRNELSEILIEKEDELFKALQDVFHLNFKNREYKGFVSIFDLNPRFPETLSFQAYYKRSLPLRLEVAVHEISHFAFFEFCNNEIADLKGSDTNSGILWELSEVFNVILLNTPPFQAILGHEEKLFYPNLKDMLEKGRSVYEEEKGDVKKWIERMITIPSVN